MVLSICDAMQVPLHVHNMPLAVDDHLFFCDATTTTCFSPVFTTLSFAHCSSLFTSIHASSQTKNTNNQFSSYISILLFFSTSSNPSLKLGKQPQTPKQALKHMNAKVQAMAATEQANGAPPAVPISNFEDARTSYISTSFKRNILDYP